MLDIRLIRENPEAVERGLADRGGAELIRPVLAQDAQRRRLVRESEDLKALRNKASEAIGQAKRRGEDAASEQTRMREVGDRIKALEAELKAADTEIERLLLQVPNLPDPSVPPGQTEAENVEVRRWGAPRDFGFAPKPHEEIGEALGLMDFERAARMSKARFVVMWGPLARLERALTDFMLDLHTREHGYTEVWVPHLVNASTMQNNGLLPKFEVQLFKTVEPDEDRTLYLIPTAEVPVTALHTGETLPEGTLPRRYVSLHALLPPRGGHVRQGHEGDDPPAPVRQGRAGEGDDAGPVVRGARVDGRQRRGSAQAPRDPVSRGAALRGRHGVPARRRATTSRCGCRAQGKYREISSCSNCGAFQARRAEIRFKPDGGGKPEFCHTLNGSGLAVGRTLIAVLENYQEADGSVTVPAALRPYMGGLERIGPA